MALGTGQEDYEGAVAAGMVVVVANLAAAKW